MPEKKTTASASTTQAEKTTKHTSEGTGTGNRRRRTTGGKSKQAASQQGTAPVKAPETASAAKSSKVDGAKRRGRKPATSNSGTPAAADTGEKNQAVSSTTAKTSTGNRRRRSTKKQPAEVRKPPVRIIPLGGLNEIGKNLTVFECQNDMIIVDCGMAFPDDEMFGVDVVIPDFTFLERNRDKLRGIVITHGHEDHIGSLAYLLKTINLPIYSTRLTLGLIDGKLKEHGLSGRVKMHEVAPGDTVKMGCMSVEFIAVNHSIPGSCGLAIFTPAGTIVHTGDFKVDFTPIGSPMIDLARFGELGSKGVLALMSDSTNSERPGATPSERKVGQSFDSLFKRAGKKRVIIATFSSNVHRVQQVVDACVKYGRKLVVSGRSMVNVMTKAIELGYLNVPDGLLIDVDLLGRYADENIVLITTGSQGEPMSALTRMAMSDHRKVTITPNDFIIISASPIPGNEKTVTRVIDELMKLGAEVIYEKMYEIHVSGHACQDEQKLMIALTKPKFFIPVHGEFHHLKKHAETALSMGIPASNIFIGDVGKVIETDGVDMKFNGVVPSGSVMVDGLGVGDVGSIVLRDRKHLAQDGLIIVVITMDSATGTVLAGPDIVSRGFVYVREAEEMMNEAKRVCREALRSCENGKVRDWGNIKTVIKDQLSSYLYGRTKRSPMILPIIQEV